MEWTGVLMEDYMDLGGFKNEVVSLNVDTGEMNVVVKGLNVPAAVKFDSKGVLHVLDTADGQVLKVIDGQLEVVASLLV